MKLKCAFKKMDPVEFSQHFYAILFYQQKSLHIIILSPVLPCKWKFGSIYI